MTKKVESITQKILNFKEKRESLEEELKVLKADEEQQKRLLFEELKKKGVKTLNQHGANFIRVERPTVSFSDEPKVMKYCQANYTDGIRMSLDKAKILKAINSGTKIPGVTQEVRGHLQVKQLEE